MAINLKEFPNKVKTNLKANLDFTKFYFRFEYDGRPYKGIIDFSDKNWNKKDRIRYAEEKLNAEKKIAEKKIDTDAKVNDLVKLYFETLTEGSYLKNLSSYYERKVKASIGSKKVRDIIPQTIQNIVHKLVKDGDSIRTAKQTIEILSPSFKIARKNRIIDYNPCDDVKLVRPKTKKIVVQATDRLKMIYEAIIKLYSNDPFYRAFFLLALQGRRKSEIINLKWAHISFDYDYYLLLDTKNDEEQKIFLPPNVKAALLEFCDNGTTWVFESPIIPGQRLSDAKKQTEKLKNEIGPWFTMHYTRNVMVSAMAENGVEAIYMSGALGHSDPNTITKYLSMNYFKGSKIASDMINLEDKLD